MRQRPYAIKNEKIGNKAGYQIVEESQQEDDVNMSELKKI